MTVASEVNRSGPYIGNGVTTSFDYGFRILNEAHIRVIRTQAEVETVLTLGDDYSVSGVGGAGGGSITTTAAPTAGQAVTILRSVPFTQETDLENQGPYFAETIEAALDLSAMRDQELSERLVRAILVSPTDTPPMTTLPPASVRALKNLSFDSLGNPSVSTPVAGTAVSSAMIPVVSASTIAIARLLLGVPDAVSTRTALKAIDTTKVTAAYLTEVGREGEFVFRSGDYSARVTADTQEGIYIKADAIATVSGAWVRVNDGRYVATWFGATGDGITNDTTAMQAAITAAVAIGGRLYIPPGSYKINSVLTISGRVTIEGAGYESDDGVIYGDATNPAAFTTKATGWKATVLICGIANGCFFKQSRAAITIQQLQITYPAQSVASVVGISLNSAAGTSGVATGDVIRDVVITGAYLTIDIRNCLEFTLDNVRFLNSANTALQLNSSNSANFTGGLNAASWGDSIITNCVFMNTQGQFHVLIGSGGGYRFVNNKFNVCPGSAILVSPQPYTDPLNPASHNFSIEPLVFVGNSIEGSPIGIKFQPNNTSLGICHQVTITGNQIWATTAGISFGAGVAIPIWINTVTVTGNSIVFGQVGGGAETGIAVAGAQYATISGNVFNSTMAGNAAVQFASSTYAITNKIRMSGNVDGNFPTLPGEVTPFVVPASNTTVTNNNPHPVYVIITGGTVSGYVINVVSINLPTGGSFTLRPGDTIAVSYSAGTPSWHWYAINP